MKTVYALGFFDGVHLGHQALITQCVRLAKELDAQAGAVTFDVHPQTVVAGQSPAMINTVADRLALLRLYGIQKVQPLHFDREFMHMPWQEFFRYLTQELDAAGLVCGDDFRFGAKGEGTATHLQQACRTVGIPCVIVPEQTVDGVRVSSTHIRSLIAQGQMGQAVAFLGHPHILTGTVISGRKLGRTIGVPTANLLLPEGVVVPKFGVYACKVRLDDRSYLAVTNVGTRPTVGGHRVTVEPWILDFEGDLYGKSITLAFYAFLRPERKFDSMEQLHREIMENARQTKEFFEKN